MVYSVNQVRQFYVVDGDIQTPVVQGADGSIVIKTTNALGKEICTDTIDPKKIEWIHYTLADAMKGKEKKVTVTLSDDAFDTDNTFSGLDYILRINFRLLFGMSDEDIYQKYGAVHGTKSMTKKEFILRMILSLMKNLSREHGHLLDFEIDGTTVAKVGETTQTISNTETKVLTAIDSTGSSITYVGKDDDITSFDIVAATLESEWALGTKKLEHIQFDVVPTTITNSDYDEVIWATTSESTVAGLSNYYEIADMEYFYHGYRGDQYRNLGWPDVIPTTYLLANVLTSNVEGGYDVLDIQYYYSGDNEDSQHVSKTITLVAPAGNANEGIHAANSDLESLVEDLSEALDGRKVKKIAFTENGKEVSEFPE